MKILILEANPHKDLSLDKEIRQLRRVIDDASNPNQFLIKDGAAAKANQIQKLMLGFEKQDPNDDPIIVHFCGHGTGEKGLVFEHDNGERDLVSTETLAKFFELFNYRIACVVMNACYSKVQAEAIVQHIDYVIGMNQAIKDDAAIAFSIGFYQALGHGKTYEVAFQFGCNAIQFAIQDNIKNKAEITRKIRKLISIDGVLEEKNNLSEHEKPALFRKIEPEKLNQTYNYHNLPHGEYPEFIGREKILQELFKQINPGYRQHITVVEGIGGVGKTSLVLEAAHLCWSVKEGSRETYLEVKIPEFDAIIFTSAKKTYLTAQGILQRPRFEETLQEIFRTIADVLQQPSIIMAPSLEEQLKLAYEYLGKQNTLLIVDNMETIPQKEQDQVITFLADLPQSTQGILTSRHKLGWYKSIPIFELSRKESLQLIKQEADNKAVKVTDYQAARFYSAFGGIPIALIYAVGQRAIGYSLKRILGLLDNEQRPSDLKRFLFKRSVEPLRGQAAHKLLMSMTFFQSSPTRDALVEVAGLQEKPSDVEEGLAILQQLSLVSEEEKRYSVLPITHNYALDELTNHKDFLNLAQNRWIQWCINFTRRYGNKDWEAWCARYDHLAQEWENIASVLHWCAARDKYDEVKQIWQNIDRYVDLGCYWRTRRHWWGWLIRKSKQRGDQATYVRALSERAWTLTLMGEKEAESVLSEAWEMKELADLDVQAHLANHIAVHRITQKQYDEALKWLEQQEQLVDRAELEERETIRHQTCITYYRAEIAYRMWEKTDNSIEYNSAKQLFKEAYEKGQQIKWQRFVNYTQNWLADLSIIDSDFGEAEKLLKSGLFVAENSKESRRIGHYYASYARLEEKKGKKDKAREYADKAIKIFDREGILEDANEMRELLKRIGS